MVEYIKIRNFPLQGKTLATESPAYQPMLVLLQELVRPIFAEEGLGQEVTVVVTITVTPAPRSGRSENKQRR